MERWIIGLIAVCVVAIWSGGDIDPPFASRGTSTAE